MKEIIVLTNVLAFILLIGTIIFLIRQKKFEKESFHEAQNIFIGGIFLILLITFLETSNLIFIIFGITLPFDIFKYINLTVNLFFLPLTAIFFFIYVLLIREEST
jgi:predicted small integral membrane protein